MAGAVAQLGEHLLCKQGVSGSIPLSSTKIGGDGCDRGSRFCLADCLGAFWWLLLVAVPFGIGAVAQLGERRNRTAEVGGSIPLGSTMILVLKEI